MSLHALKEQICRQFLRDQIGHGPNFLFACGKAMHENIPNSTLEVLKNSGHVPMEENPKESVEMLKRFLEEN